MSVKEIFETQKYIKKNSIKESFLLMEELLNNHKKI